MKHFKRVAIAASAAFFMVGAAFAQQSATNAATAKTILTDADKFMDVNEWSDSSFKNSFGFGEVGLQRSVALGFASKTMFPLYFGAYYSGNLWTEDSTNNIAVLFGTGDLGIGVGFATLTETEGAQSFDVKVPSLSVGYNAMGGKLKLNAGFAYAFASSESELIGIKTVYKYSAPVASVGAMYEVMSNKALSVALGGRFNYSSEGVSVSVNGGTATTPTKNQTIIVGPQAKVSYKLTDSFNYGLTAYIPFSFADTITTVGDTSTTVHNHNIYFNVNNGFSADIVKNTFKLNAGVETSLPSISLDDDGTNGILTNVYYAGFSLLLSDSVTIDSAARIFNGSQTESLDDIWNTGLAFTVSMKF